MSKRVTAYQLLNVREGADLEEIVAAFKRLDTVARMRANPNIHRIHGLKFAFDLLVGDTPPQLVNAIDFGSVREMI